MVIPHIFWFFEPDRRTSVTLVLRILARYSARETIEQRIPSDTVTQKEHIFVHALINERKLLANH